MAGSRSGTLSPKQVVSFHRNRWYPFTETGGILLPKYPNLNFGTNLSNKTKPPNIIVQ
jgi:hypothetical protein